MADNLKKLYTPTLIAVNTVVNLVAGQNGKTTRCVIRIHNLDTAAQTCYLAVSTANNDVTNKGIIPPAFSIAPGDFIVVGADDGPIVLENGDYLNFQATNASKLVVSVFGAISDVQ